MEYPFNEYTNHGLDKDERLVVNAIKGKYDKELGITDSYKLALDIIERVVYGNKQGQTPYTCKLDFLRDLLFKAFPSNQLELWEQETQDRFRRAYDSLHVWKEDFFEAYLNLHLSDVMHLQVNRSRAGGGIFCILDLDVDADFERKALDELKKSDTI